MDKLLKHNEADSASHHFLTGAILFANLDGSGLLTYGFKAAIGGMIWMAFKVAEGYFTHRLANRRKTKQEKENENDDHLGI